MKRLAIFALIMMVSSFAFGATAKYVVTPSDLVDTKSAFSATHGTGNGMFAYDWDSTRPDTALGAPTGFGNSSYYASVDNSGATQPDRYRTLRLGIRSIFGRPVKISDIASIKYMTNKPAPETGIDWRLSIYTTLEAAPGNSAGWYRSRIQSHPNASLNLNAPANTWNLWSTDAGTNQLRFYQSNRIGFGEIDILWSELVSGPVTRGTYTWDFSNEDVMMIDLTLGANSGGGTGSSSMDAIEITLTNGDKAILDLSGTDVYVDGVNGSDLTGDGTSANPYKTIQKGVDSAPVGSTIKVLPATYEEQVSITKDVNIEGSGVDSTIISSPASLTGYPVVGIPSWMSLAYPVVYVNNATVDISDLTIDGNGKGNANYGFYGVIYWNAGGGLSKCVVKNVSDTPFSGAQHCVGVGVYNSDAAPRDFAMTYCKLVDNQKNATVFKGAGLSVVIRYNQVIGKGVTTVTAQNGLQISDGVTGKVEYNEVTGFYYGGPSWTASAMMDFGGGVDWKYNTVTLSNFGLYVASTANTLVYGNNFTANDWSLVSNTLFSVDAGGNWWGTPTGPMNPGIPGTIIQGYGEYVYDYNSVVLNFGSPLAKPATPNTVYLEPPVSSLYVKPAETVTVDMKVANLLFPVTGLQAMLNFSSTYFKAGAGEVGVAAGGGVWDQLIYNVWNTGGDLDVAVGVDLNTAGGTMADATTAVLTLTPTGAEGVTTVVFRPDLDPDPYLIGSTFLSDVLSQPIWPVKVNSTNIYIDGTAPVMTSADITAVQTQPIFGTVNVKNCANGTVQGTVNIQVKASDGLSGLVSAPTITVLPSGLTPVYVNESPDGTFNYTILVDGSTPLGAYTLTVTAEDKAGNQTVETFTLCVMNVITGQVQLEGYMGSTRTVTFVTTGATTKTYTMTLNFTAGVATYLLTDVPNGTTGVSAKTNWTLRKKLPVTLTGGIGTADFIGAAMLLGGDINNSNSINILDYSVMKTYWGGSAVGDINGDGYTGTVDYALMKNNWFKVGDPQ